MRVFTKSKDGKEWYIIYHAISRPDAGEPVRIARMQQFHWDEKSGYSLFGHPVPLNAVFP